jgi:hypothetical protein
MVDNIFTRLETDTCQIQAKRLLASLDFRGSHALTLHPEFAKYFQLAAWFLVSVWTYALISFLLPHSHYVLTSGLILRAVLLELSSWLSVRSEKYGKL